MTMAIRQVRFLRIAPLILAASGLAACAVNPREHFGQVQDLVLARTGQRVRWNTQGTEDQQVQQAVHEMLQHELTVEQSVQIALLNNAELQATYEDLGIAQADLVQAGLLKNPVISAEIRFPGRPQFPVEANLEDEFLDVLFLPLRKKVAEASFEQAKAMVAGTVIQRASEVRSSFYKYQAAMQLLDMRRTVLEAADANLDASRRLREAGNSRELDYANDQGLAAQAKIDVSEAEAQVAESREDLTAIMGVWGPDAAAWSVAPRLPEPAGNDASLDGLESLAVRQRQDLLASQQSVIASARTAGFANYAALLSGGTLGVHYQRDADVKSTIGPAISAPIPIFDQGQAVSAKTLAEFRQAQDRYTALAVQIRSQVRKAQYRMTTARERADYYKNEVIPLRHRIVEQTQLQYNGMFVGVSVLLQAKQEEINAGAHFVEALRDYWIARTELEQAVGGRLVEPTATSSTNVPATSPAMPPMPGMNHETK